MKPGAAPGFFICKPGDGSRTPVKVSPTVRGTRGRRPVRAALALSCVLRSGDCPRVKISHSGRAYDAIVAKQVAVVHCMPVAVAGTTYALRLAVHVSATNDCVGSRSLIELAARVKARRLSALIAIGAAARLRADPFVYECGSASSQALRNDE